MWAWPSTASASLPVMPLARRSTSMTWLSHLRVLDHLLRVILEAGFQRFLERHGLAGDDVHQRTALDAGEDRRVDDLLVLGLHHDDAAARAAQRLVRR
ncbi:hypothetical protein G6F65_023241 [Rhizopus arrhizus]|nr:hypothetical protein G6F65_023241 [Rhizopus arrhizus]